MFFRQCDYNSGGSVTVSSLFAQRMGRPSAARLRAVTEGWFVRGPVRTLTPPPPSAVPLPIASRQGGDEGAVCTTTTNVAAKAPDAGVWRGRARCA